MTLEEREREAESEERERDCVLGFSTCKLSEMVEMNLVGLGFWFLVWDGVKDDKLGTKLIGKTT